MSKFIVKSEPKLLVVDVMLSRISSIQQSSIDPVCGGHLK